MESFSVLVLPMNAFDLASGDVESGDQGLSAVALIFEPASLDLARHR